MDKCQGCGSSMPGHANNEIALFQSGMSFREGNCPFCARTYSLHVVIADGMESPCFDSRPKRPIPQYQRQSTPGTKNLIVGDRLQQILLCPTTFSIDRWFQDECEAYVLTARYSRPKCLIAGSAETPLPYDSTRRRTAKAKCYGQGTDKEAMAGPQIWHTQRASSSACVLCADYPSAGHEALPVTCYHGSYSNRWTGVHSVSG